MCGLYHVLVYNVFDCLCVCLSVCITHTAVGELGLGPDWEQLRQFPQRWWLHGVAC